MLKSISTQEGIDFNSFEIIVINNCDKPKKPKIISKHLYPNLNIRYILSKEKNYIGASRQTGIDNCKGEYLMFVDSDDALKSTAVISTIYQTIHDYPSYDIYVFDEEQELKDANGNFFWVTITSTAVTPHSKIFRTDFIKSNNIRHLSGIRYSEDTLFNLNCIINKPKAIKVNYPIYKNFYNKDSTSHSDSLNFIKAAAFSHCLGTEKLAEIYKDEGTAVFNTLVANLLNLQSRVESKFTFETAIYLTIYKIYNIIDNINDEEVTEKDILNKIKQQL